MNSGNSNMLLRLADTFGFLTIEAACAVSEEKPNTVSKKFAKLVELGLLVKAPFIHPRCYWYPRGKPLGVQKLVQASSTLYRCVQAESRIWQPERREGPATIIADGEEREALFVDYGAPPRFIARKITGWCHTHDLVSLTAVSVVVPSEHKAQAINRAVEGLPLPLRFIISEDLGGLTCVKARP